VKQASSKQETACPDDFSIKTEQEYPEVKWTPLIDADEKKKAKDYGHSFGSKKVAMAPGFVNLRFMCHCLAKAIKRHLEFGQNHWFL
jgi:hypothetical protein